VVNLGFYWIENKANMKETESWYTLRGLIEVRGHTSFYLVILIISVILLALLIYFR